MRFSLIVATLNRSDELGRLLESLNRQDYRDFEVIVIDQNSDDRLVPILRPFENRLEIRRLVSAPGLSRARNLGLRGITGEVVGFPDDDCSYPEDVLTRVNQALTDNPRWQGVIGDSVDISGQPTLPWRDRKGKLTLPMCWRRAVTYAFFLRSSVIKAIGGFDEKLGPGAGVPWISGEDNDLLLRGLKADYYVEYDPGLHIHHPKMFPAFDQSGWAKRRGYALGDGYLLRKHPMPLWWDLLFFSVPVCRALLAAVRLKRNETYFHWLTFSGRWKGFISAGEPDSAGVPFPLEDHSLAARVSQ